MQSVAARRRAFITLLGGAAAMPLAARAQQGGKLWRIGYLSGIARPPSLQASYFGGSLEGIRELGYIEGRDYLVEWRFADGHYERFPDLAAELVRLKVDVIVVAASAAIRPVQQATGTIPTVFSYSIDPVGNGLVTSLARPGGNTTGLSSSLEDIVAKHVELLAMAVPGLSRIAVLVDPSNPNHPEALKKAEAAASLGGLAIIVVEARTSDELESSFRAMREHGVGALVALPDSLFTN